jgi:DNA-binding NarL/FixJ family response regulator
MKDIEILIVTRSVVLQQGLGALLESLPEVATVKAIRNLSDAYTWIEERQLHIVLLDEELTGKNTKAALEKIRSLSPAVQRVLLADDVQQVNLLITHAEAVVIKGIQPSAIASTISNLLSTKGEEHEPHNDSN